MAPEKPRRLRATPGLDGLRDTIESIVIAFILAFVFRAFVVEAFVIPTGSMAPTLYGEHKPHRCSNCAYVYAFGIREGVVQEPFHVVCPNCGHFRDYYDASQLPLVDDAGDRILVLKWPFDIGGAWLGPQRWSVGVFKNPQDGKQNFIKRLVGMPNEVLEIIDGDIYAAPAAEVPPRLLEKLMHDAFEGAGRDLTESDFRDLDRALKIQRKPRPAQQSLWMLHYDHDYPPHVTQPESPYWDAGGSPDATGWDASTSVVDFDGRESDRIRLELAGKPITDFYAYNKEMLHHGGRRELRFVSDVRLRFALTPHEPTGRLSISLTKRDDEFRATIHADGRVTLAHRNNPGGADSGAARRGRPTQVDRWTELASTKIDALRPGRAKLVEFENVDYRVTLRLDGRDILATSDAQYAPDTSALRRRRDGEGPPARVALAASGMPLTLRHLAVYRDVHYRGLEFPRSTQPSARTGGGFGPATGYGRNGLFSEHGHPTWGSAGNPIFLREGEFFVCGDNSPASQDSRLWQDYAEFLHRRDDAYQRGTVPIDQMIGRAFFVYWPAGYRLGERGLPVIPNVGRMRIIR